MSERACAAVALPQGHNASRPPRCPSTLRLPHCRTAQGCAVAAPPQAIAVRNGTVILPRSVIRIHSQWF
uniref:Uncharacterized protein n=1 Tax=Oryza rufipogon TaxID=4529 RepID=A0A0E0MSD9_ORYRU